MPPRFFYGLLVWKSTSDTIQLATGSANTLLHTANLREAGETRATLSRVHPVSHQNFNFISPSKFRLMLTSVRKSKWDAWWVDVLMAILIFASAQAIVLGAGHGVGLMGSLLLEAPFQMLLPFWGGHLYASALLIAGSPSPRRVKRFVRLLCVAAGFGYTLFFISFSDTPEITAISSAPVLLALLILTGISCGSEFAHQQRRRRSRQGAGKV